MGMRETFKALAEPVRREILSALKEDTKTAGDLAKRFQMSPSAMSYHLSQLKQADLIRENKKGNFIYYELNSSIMEEIILWLQQLIGEQEKENRGEMGNENH